ncbi:MAG: hypothetical protein LUC85_04725 [Bacteroidales bacterium]|nr:hypothetical protein [Bacteroidales bacterium]MCD8394122.1 hypothetical protein [Bacteroidales bacterium]
MHRIITILALIAIALPVVAQKQADDAEREQWFKEVREYKHQFLAKELQLTKDQQKKFFTLYDEMEDENTRIANEAKREEEAVVAKGEKATDADYERASEILYDQKVKEGEVEKTYMKKFQNVLSKKQLFQLKGAERKFTRDLMKHHRRLRQDKAKK